MRNQLHRTRLSVDSHGRTHVVYERTCSVTGGSYSVSILSATWTAVSSTNDVVQKIGILQHAGLNEEQVTFLLDGWTPSEQLRLLCSYRNAARQAMSDERFES